MNNRDKMEIFKSAATNAVAKMAFVSMMVFGCDNQKEVASEPAKKIITLHDQAQAEAAKNKIKSVVALPCVIQVPCREPELELFGFSTSALYHEGFKRKYYDFCDSTVSIVGWVTGDGASGAYYSVRPITELLGTEKAEMKSAYAQYQQSLNPQ